MTVTDLHPSIIGQRVQEPYGDTRGYVTGFDDDDVFVTWDQPEDVDAEVGDFKVDELRVVAEVRIDLDHLLDPSLSPLVEQVTMNGMRFEFRDGTICNGVTEARDHLLKLHRTPRAV